MDELEKYRTCRVCHGRMELTSAGKFICERCGAVELNDFGKVKAFLDENGPSTAFVISQATGVRLKVVDELLLDGRLEIPEGSKEYIHCQKCGCEIRYGRYCPDCARSLVNDIKKAFYMGDVGAKPRKTVEGKMYYINHKKKKDE